MKKILGLIGLVGILLTSCKNDAIEISRVPTPEPPKTLSLSISTTSAYEKYGLADYQNYLGSNSTTYIAVTSLLYNSSGTLVDSASSYSRTFNAISQSFSGLYNGSYTIITFETLVDSSNGFKSNNWQLKDINNISTVQVHNEKYNHVSWQYSVGVSTQVVEINSADRQIEISPKPIGVLLDFGYENYGKSGYIWTAFELKNVASGYNLNPSLSANERYTYDDGYNVDFFDVQTSGSSVNSNFKTAIASWFKTTYTIAQVLSLIVLIYIGIRMAMATNPEEKVNYKKMLKNWITSFVILFLLRYVIVILLEIANWLLTLIPESISGKNFESEIINKMFRLDDTESAWTTLIYALSYVIIVGYEVYFFIKYFKRILVMGFLVIVSPLITVTYAIDKADDGKAQAFETWRKMFISNTFMQPIHALLYTIFIYSASEIALKAPLIAVVFFMGILKGEDIFNKLFNLQKT